MNNRGDCERRIPFTFSFHKWIFAWLCFSIFMQQSVDAWVSDITLSTFVSGSDGMIIWGAAAGDKSGICVSGGDINGDGYGDVIVGSPNDDLNGLNTGAAHVLFGHGTPFATVDLQPFTSGASFGYKYNGVSATGKLGAAVAVLGDMNGDGLKDSALVCPSCSSPSQSGNGIIYVMYSRLYNATFAQNTLASYPTGSGGFRIFGDSSGDLVDTSIASAGDFNKDGRADLLVSAPAKSVYGVVYVIFGQANANTADIDLDPSQFFASASTGFRISGGGTTTVYSKVGQSVAAAGDVNGDTYDDIVIGAPATSYGGRTGCGAAVVIFGRSAASSFNNIVLSSGFTLAMGFSIYGALDNDELGFSVGSIRNMNGDSYSDLILGAPNVNSVSGATSQGGSVWVYYGRSASVNIDLISMNSLGVVFFNLPSGSNLGYAVAGVGDVNGDGYDDFAFTAPGFPFNSAVNVGVLHLIYGRAGAFSTPQNLNTFAGFAEGYRVFGPAAGVFLGYSLSSAGDLNKDGMKDMIVGAHLADANGRTGAGVSYVLFGMFTGPTTSPSQSPVSKRPSVPPSLNPSLNPTAVPTVSPSFAPSTGPSLAPSRAPSLNPTINPTINPSLAPSAGPSRSPSLNPTVNPTVNPTASPSFSPSITPTVLPSLAPSRAPSLNPTVNPTASPSLAPSAGPSLAPSRTPSQNPTLNPSVSPSVSPSLAPSRAPSLNPTVNPTASPSFSPSITPTISPSFAPSRAPSLNPTVNPTVNPTASPSGAPTVSPSLSPSMSPSVAPSRSPSLYPTVNPTVSPSLAPSVGPSLAPSTSPTVYPSVNPTCNPSFNPSVGPTVSPSSNPTLNPSVNPSASPSVSPSAAPSLAPSRTPSLGPSISPTVGPSVTPSASPSINPTTNPTVSSSVRPSMAPSVAPSVMPSKAPSLNPSMSPSLSPSAGPSLVPSAAPSLAPSKVPSVNPTMNPTIKPSACPSVQPSYAPTSSPTLSLSALTTNGNGKGFVVYGATLSKPASVVAGPGDVNGDGFPDILIGAPGAGVSGSDVVYVLFGKGAAVSYNSIDLANFVSGPSTGYKITADAGGAFGTSVGGLGDVNGDGLDDFIVGAPFTTANSLANAGMAYVFYGKSCSVTCPDIAAEPFTAGAAGFRVFGSIGGGLLGISVSNAGDFNGDGRKDIIIGCPYYSYGGQITGAAFIIFGRTNAATTDVNIQAWNSGPSMGVRVLGDGSSWFSIGQKVSAAGLLNRDNYADVLIGAPSTNFNGRSQCGAALVLFGRGSSYTDVFIDSMAQTNTTGFVIYGAHDNDGLGGSLTPLAHFDGDSYADIAIGAPVATDMNGVSQAGYVVILYGRALSTTLTYLDLSLPRPAYAVAVSGGTVNVRSSKSIAAGDFNKDGYTDLVIGVPSTSGNPGATYVLFGQASKRTDQSLLSFSASVSQGFAVQGTGVDQSGAAVSSLFDFNGDGFDDLIIGSPSGTSLTGAAGAGRSYVLFGTAYGQPTALPTLAPSVNPSMAPTVGPTFMLNDLTLYNFVASTLGFPIKGGGNSYYSGYSVSGGGDVNGDGRADMIIGSKNFAGGAGIDSGAVHVVFGKSTSPTSPVDLELTAFNAAQSGYFLAGANAGDLLGTSVKYLGDVNSDSLGDFAVGAPGVNGGSGIVYVVYGCSVCTNLYLSTWVTGARGFRIFGISPNDGAGTVVASAGDFNNDGIRDILVGAPSYAYSGFASSGAAYVIFGRTGSTPSDIYLSLFTSSSTAGMRFFGTSSADIVTGVGSVLSGAGDFNGDGFEDIILGMPLSTIGSLSSCGLVAVIFGRNSNFHDVVFTGFTSSNTEGFLVVGAATNAMLGVSVTTLGYFDSDNKKDIAISAGASANSGQGYVLVLYGRAVVAGTIDLATANPVNNGGFYCTSFSINDVASRKIVSNAGDVNGDGIGDLLIGVPLNDNGDTDAGMTFLVYGRATRFTSLSLSSFQSTSTTGYRINGGVAGDYSGFALSAAGDVNGDGVGDFLVGAYLADPGRNNAGITYVVYGIKVYTPSVAPSALPSIQPSVAPSVTLTAVPTVSPSVQPSASPTAVPSAVPSASPSIQPSASPTAVPSAVPSASPSLQPSVAPTTTPSAIPSKSPSLQPSTSPTAIPSAVPSASPSLQPSLAPSVTLTAVPTVSPSVNPSISPTLTPSAAPSRSTAADIDLLSFVSGVDGLFYGGAKSLDNMGTSATDVGDFNGDGLNEFAFSSYVSMVNGQPYVGTVYVLLGMASVAGYPPHSDLTNFTTTPGIGFLVHGAGPYDQFGRTVLGVGDLNGDDLADLAVLSWHKSAAAGSSIYVIYGSTVPVVTAVNITSFQTSSTAGYQIFCVGLTSSANVVVNLARGGDVNGDGLNDFVVSVPTASYGGGSSNGGIWIIYGTGYAPSDIYLQSHTAGPRGFSILGSSGGSIGASLCVSDLDYDGLADVIFTQKNVPGGSSFVLIAIYGGAIHTDFNMTTFVSGDSGFKLLLSAVASQINSPALSRLGDFNGDGVDDVALGFPSYVYSGRPNAGTVVVYFGPGSRPVTTVDLAAAKSSGGATMFVGEAGSNAISFPNEVGDLNGDDVNDIIFSGRSASYNSRASCGTSYVMFGGSQYNQVSFVDLANLASGVDGFRIYGATAGDFLGLTSGAAGDLNRDGVRDFCITSPVINAFGRSDNGGVYAIFGKQSLQVSKKPTVVPTPSPSRTPTRIPSANPTLQPSVNPTALPSIQPSVQPSVTPSANPSLSPSIIPTAQPSFSVSVSPSNNLWVPDIPLSSFTSGLSGQIIWGAATGDRCGTSVSGGDVNGDGYSDVVVSAVENDESIDGAGAVYALFGHSAPFSTVDLTPVGFVQSATTGLKYRGFEQNNKVGRAVAVLGDINGDGIKDYAIGCPYCGIDVRTGNGAVFVLFGRRFNETFAIQTLFSYTTGSVGFRIYGESGSDGAGASVAAAGDFNKDGFADLLVGAPDQPAGDGYVYLILGKSNANIVDIDLAAFTPSSTCGFKITGGNGATATFSQIGRSMSAAGDVNGDTFDDFIIGAPGTTYGGRASCGAAVVIFGHGTGAPFANIDLSLGVASTVGFNLYGAATNDNFGFSVGVIKNMNGDSYPDFVIGAPNTAALAGSTSAGGSVWLYYGRSTFSTVDFDVVGGIGVLFKGSPSNSRLGYAVAGLGDINGDGLDDFAMSSPSQRYGGNNNVGIVYVFYGKISPFATLQDLSVFASGAQGYRVIGSSVDAFLGNSLSSAGDYNKDGLKDIVVGAYNADANGRVGAGLSYVLFGISTVPTIAPTAAPSGPPSVNPTMIPTRSPSVDPTVYPTLAPSVTSSTAVPTVETVDRYSNALTSAQGFNILGAADGDNLGSVVANIGDINGDGIDDLAMSAPNFDIGNLLNAGVVYVLYGNRTRPVSDIDLLNFQTGRDGFRIIGPTSNSAIGNSINIVENINDDGAKHILIGARTGKGKGPADAGAVYVVKAYPYQADVNISSPLFATQGFTISGELINDRLGNAVSAGDFDGDGSTDLLLSAYSAIRNGASSNGVAYLLLGRPSSNPFTDIQLADFVSSYTWGLRIIGANVVNYILGTAIAAAGDVNNDGFADVAVGAAGALLPGPTSTSVGFVFVIFGGFDFSNGDLVVDAEFTRNGYGFRLIGALASGRFGYALSTSVDVNGDGIRDFLVGAPNTPNPTQSGTLYVIYGRHWSEMLNDVYMSNLTVSTGYWIKGNVLNARLGHSVAAAGDVNGDGTQDFVVGAPQTPLAYALAGVAHVIYGTRDFRSNINLALGLPSSVGFRLLGTSVNNRVGNSVSAAGDFNGDGLADIITGNYLTSSTVPNRQAIGTVTVLFGFSNNPTQQPTARPTILPTFAPSLVPRLMSPSDIDLTYLIPSQGYRVKGALATDYAGAAIRKLSDINGDGVDELMINAPRHPYLGRSLPGVTYILYGNSTRHSALDIDLLNFQSGASGFLIAGPADSQVGFSLGEVRGFFGDNKTDIVLGTPLEFTAAGVVYVFRGSAYDRDVDLTDVTSAPGLRIYGPEPNARLGTAIDTAGDFNGDGINDLVVSAGSASSSTLSQCGLLYVIFGKVRSAPYGNITLATFVSSPTTGVRIWGAALNHQLGWNVGGAFDVNSDGKDDIFATTYFASSSRGIVYVIFGQANPTADIDLATFDNTMGFRIVGAAANDRLGIAAASARDINGDGRPDFILGASTATRTASQQGVAYVIYGPDPTGGFPDILLADFVPGAAGFRIFGEGASNRVGCAVSNGGDVNGDGLPDLLVGAFNGAPFANKAAGIVYVIYGTHAPIGDIYLNDTIPISSGFRILGEVSGSKLGSSVTLAGDVNNDGYDDILIGAPQSNAVTGRTGSGTSYVVYGFSNVPSAAPTVYSIPTVRPTASPSVTPSIAFTAQPTIQTAIDLQTLASSPQLGYQIVGEYAADSSGGSVAAAGDLNRDGLQDFLLSAAGYDYESVIDTGIVYVLFGQETNVSTLDLRNFTTGTRGFRITGIDYMETLGRCVSSAGDFDGDGYPDIMVSATLVAGTASYGVYVFLNLGRTPIVADIAVYQFVTGSAGFVIYGSDTDGAGYSLSPAGDMNNDGVDDIIVGASAAVGPTGASQTGIAYVIFGKRTTVFSDIYLSAFFSGPAGFRVIGAAGGDNLAYSVSSAGDVNGDEVDDVIIGARNVMINGQSGAGAAYVIFGHSNATAFADIDVGNFSSGYYIPGFNQGGRTGASVSGAGDVNGDGIADIIVGSYGASAGITTSAGKAHVIFGQRQPYHSFRVVYLSTFSAASGAGFRVNGVFSSQLLGRTVSSAGDINADGYDDVLVTSQGATGANLIIYGHNAATSFVDINFATFVSGPLGFAMMNGPTTTSFASALGDTNGDGVDDILIGFSAGNFPGRAAAGLSYIIYGRKVYPANTLAPTTHPTMSPTKVPTRAPTIVPTVSPTQTAGDVRLPLGNDNTRGVKITGRPGYSDNLGYAVSGAGDMDGDGCDEVLISSPFADNFDGLANGVVYLIFGHRSNFTAVNVDLNNFESGVYGIRIVGYQLYSSGGAAELGHSVSIAGDVNGDGLADIILGAPGFNPSAQRVNAGAAFIVFGAFNLSLAGDLLLSNLNGYNGFAIIGKYAGGQTGFSVASAGDWNDDGLDDVLIGTPFASPQSTAVGAAFIVFTSSDNAGHFEDIDLSTFTAADGVQIMGPANKKAYFGYVVAAVGDINGDGKPDAIIGAPIIGTVYVVYGNATDGTVFVDSLFIYGAGYKIFDESHSSSLGLAVSGAGDVNNDGIDDLVLGMPYANPGLVLVLYGHGNIGLNKDLNFTSATIDATRGFVIVGPISTIGSNAFGAALSSAGDLNGDGVGDFLVGSPLQSSYGLDANGAVYAFYGNSTSNSLTIDATTFQTVNIGFRIVGSGNVDGVGNAVGKCDFNGDGTPDLVFGASTCDGDAGASYVVFGSPPPQTVSPTVSPTDFPTATPTLFPISIPTLNPSRVPICLPSTNPTIEPSVSSSGDPTWPPSVNPTVAPSVDPSVDPTLRPTVSPSVSPSVGPSVNPSVDPTLRPTVSPSSVGPSVNPSVDPTLRPTVSPSVSPSVGPSVNPSVDPTLRPTVSPSVYPSVHPSISPSVTPSTNPTVSPSVVPTVVQTTRPSANPTGDPSLHPSAQPTPGVSFHPSLDPTMISSAPPTVLPSASRTEAPSAHPSLQTTVVPSQDPSVEPSLSHTSSPASTAPAAPPSVPPTQQPSALPSSLPSSQPSGQPTTQPTNQPAAKPSRQPSSQPSGQPTSDPSAAPTKALVPGEWAAEIGNKTALSVVAPVNDVLWACGSSLEGAGGAPSCLVANTETGAVLMRYKFPWDAITSIVSTTAFNSVYLTGRVTTTAVSSNIAVCAISEVPLFCAVQGFPNLNILGASFNAAALKIVYVGLNSIHASATLYDTGTSTATNYVYTNPNMQSITLSRVQSASSFIGSFVAGTGVRTAGATNFIVMGWLRADTGQLSAAVIGPTSGSIMNRAELVNAMALESTGPDSFIGGSLQLSDGAGVNAYVVRCNALYRSVVYAARYRARTNAASRRMLSTTVADSFTSTKMTAMVLVGDLSYMAIELTSVSQDGVTLKSLSVVKALTLSGSILKQVLITSTVNASLSCTDISFTGLNLNLACSAQYQSSFKQSVLLSADPELTFSQLPTGFIRSTRNNTLLMEKVPMQAFSLPMTTTVTAVASERYAYTDSEHKPSLKPTAAPKVSPTQQPSSAPSGQPSSSPTATPSVSSQPSSHPSTSGPTATYKPSIEPSVRPTIRPSVTSTVKPSVRQSRAPSVRPTIKPSNRPTPQPSKAPTPNPTRSPVSPTRTPTRSPSIAKTVSPTRSPSVETTTPDVPPTETAASNSKGNNISVIIGASLGGAVCFLFLAYAAKAGIRHAHKEMIKQKKLDDYFKRLDLLKDNNDAAAIIPMMMVPERYKKRGGAYINSSPANSSTRRTIRNRNANYDITATNPPSLMPESLPEESVASSQINSSSCSYDISSFHTSDRSSGQSVQHEKYKNSSSLHHVSRETLLEEGRAVDIIRNASSQSDISSSAVSTSSNETGSSVDSAVARSGVGSGVIESGSIIGTCEIGGDRDSDDISNDTEVTIESGAEDSEEESIEISNMGSEASADSLEEDAGFQDFMQAMSDEFHSTEASSQDDVSTELST